MTKEKIKVLYIGGLNRSGSTLITKYLNEFEGFFSVNEVVFIGIHGLHDDFLLGNGERFSQNKVWQEIIIRAFGTAPKWKELSFFENNIHKNLGLPARYLTQSQKDNSQTDQYRKNLVKLYRAIADVTQCTVIVDSSKSPDYAYMLSTIDDIDLYLLHLTRDFRGIYFSQKKRVQRSDVLPDDSSSRNMRQTKLWKFLIRSYLVSIKFFLLQKRNIKYTRLRYEDFCQSPEIFARKMLDFLRCDISLLLTEDQHKITLREENIGIWGNPMRMGKEIIISQDKEWRDKLPAGRKRLLSYLLYPLFKIYDY